jgi:hypothetical protein
LFEEKKFDRKKILEEKKMSYVVDEKELKAKNEEVKGEMKMEELDEGVKMKKKRKSKGNEESDDGRNKKRKKEKKDENGEGEKDVVVNDADTNIGNDNNVKKRKKGKKNEGSKNVVVNDADTNIGNDNNNSNIDDNINTNIDNININNDNINNNNDNINNNNTNINNTNTNIDNININNNNNNNNNNVDGANPLKKPRRSYQGFRNEQFFAKSLLDNMYTGTKRRNKHIDEENEDVDDTNFEEGTLPIAEMESPEWEHSEKGEQELLAYIKETTRSPTEEDVYEFRVGDRIAYKMALEDGTYNKVSADRILNCHGYIKSNLEFRPLILNSMRHFKKEDLLKVDGERAEIYWTEERSKKLAEYMRSDEGRILFEKIVEDAKHGMKKFGHDLSFEFTMKDFIHLFVNQSGRCMEFGTPLRFNADSERQQNPFHTHIFSTQSYEPTTDILQCYLASVGFRLGFTIGKCSQVKCREKLEEKAKTNNPEDVEKLQKFLQKQAENREKARTPAGYIAKSMGFTAESETVLQQIKEVESRNLRSAFAL